MRNRIIIMVSALILIIAAYYILVKFEPNKKPDDIKIDDKTISIFNTKSENIVSIIIKTNDFEYTLEKSDENWFKSGNGDASYLNQSSVASLASSLANLNAESLIANEGNLSDYGLDKPLGMPKITLKDGSEKQFIVGNLSPTGSGYYFKMADSNVIYTIQSGDGKKFISELNTFRNRTIASVVSSNLAQFKLKRADADISLKARDKSEITESSMNVWTMTSPFTKDCSNEILSKEVFEKLSFNAKDFIDDNPKSYAVYGLQTPKYEITYSEKDKAPITIYLGNEKEGAIYAKHKDTPYVYSIDLTDVSYKDINPVRLLDSLVYLKAIDKVNSITLFADETYTLKIVRDGDNTTYYVNDIAADEKKFKKAYQELIGLSLYGAVDKPVTGRQMCKIVFNFNDGSPDGIVEVYEYGDRYAAVKTDGKTEFYIMRDQVNTMISSIKTFLSNPGA